MSKQIYIDSNGNEVQVSGTVNSADMLPLEAGSSKMTSEAIGDLSSLATTNKDSLVEAVNEKATIVDVGRVDSTSKTITFSSTVRLLICWFGGSDNRLGAYIAFGRSSTSYAQPLLTSSTVTITPNNNTITVTTNTNNIYFSLVIISGSTDDFVIT